MINQEQIKFTKKTKFTKFVKFVEYKSLSKIGGGGWVFKLFAPHAHVILMVWDDFVLFT